MTPEERYRWIEDACDAGYRASLCGVLLLASLGWPLFVAFLAVTVAAMAATFLVLWRTP